jgi:dipeptidyl aminopeptidase/acylaminoacyl peptidase
VTEEEELVMNHHRYLCLAAWKCFVVIACVLLAVGCQDGSGPGLVTSPDIKGGDEGVKPPPPPPPPPADPAIALTELKKAYSYLKVMNTDGSNLTTILSLQVSTQGAVSFRPSWSPGGDRIAFSRRGELWLIDVRVVNGVPTGSNTRLLVSRTADRLVDWVSWSPNGEQILYTRSYNTSSYPAALEVVSATGGDPVQLYWSASGLGEPVWSPDARRIAFTEQLADHFSRELRVLNLDDMTVTTVAGSEWHPYRISWGRAHDLLAFDNGAARIYTIELPSGTPTDVGQGSAPDWSPNDQEIVYAYGGVWKLEVATGRTTRLAGSGVNPAWRRF